jgi:hypothetical protein
MIKSLNSFLAVVVLSLAGSAWGADPAQSPNPEASAPDPAAQVALLKSQLAAQQKQIDQLTAALAEEKQVLEQLASTIPAGHPANRVATMGEVASLTPVISGQQDSNVQHTLSASANPAFGPGSLTMAAAPMAAIPATQAPDAAPPTSSPLQIKIGDTSIMPVGFMDLTTFWRDKNAASSMGSNFGSIPYNNAVNGNLSEFHFSTQNSRIGFRVDGDWKGAHFIGYNEFDFNGTSGSTAMATSNGAIVPRLRLFWVDVRKDKVEFLAGQSWSMLVPNRKGISALPGDLFYSQVVDINYVAGLTWTRQP